MLGKSWAYTASLDAAMTLVPEGHCGQVQFGKHPGAWVAALAEQHPDDFNMAVTPALGLCAAALKARALAPIETGTAKSRRL